MNHSHDLDTHNLYLRLRSEGAIAYDKRYDAFYMVGSGVWFDDACSDPECEFCKDRPEMYEP